MKRRSDYEVLDRIRSAEGVVELAVYEANQNVWLGVSRDSEGMIGAIGLGTRSRERDVDTSAFIDETWAVAWGSVSGRVARAELRNDDGEVFPARIIPISPMFSIEGRAVWGTAERCERECVVVGYDDRGEAIDPVDFPVARRIKLGQGEDPIGGRWRIWIGYRREGPILFRETAWGDGGTGLVAPPTGGFAAVSCGGGSNEDARGCDAVGLVSAEAAWIEAYGTSGEVRTAYLVDVPQEVAGPMKAFIAFLPHDDTPRRLMAYRGDNEVLAVLNLP
ncbi:MAG: hypothetical protein ACRDH8_07435 [Actinomycetota bacterium]